MKLYKFILVLFISINILYYFTIVFKDLNIKKYNKIQNSSLKNNYDSILDKIENKEINQLSSIVNKYHHPLLSIIIPVYNQIKYIDVTLNSLINQKVFDWEVIIVDDGSTEWYTKQQLYNLFNQYSYLINITILFEDTNGGLSWSRNHGISISNGKWILPLDSDDFISLDFLNKSFDIIHSLDRNNNNTIIISNVKGFIENEKTNMIEKIMTWNIPSFDSSLLKIKNLLHCSAIFKKSVWKSIEGYNENLWFGWEDWDFWFRMDKSLQKSTGQGLNISVINEELFNYRMKPGMHSFCKENYQLCFAMFQTCNPKEYSISDLINSHRRIGMEGDKIILPLKKRIKKYPNSYVLHLWLGLVYEYNQSYKNINLSRKEYDLAIFNSQEGNDWQPIVLRLLVDRGTDSFDESKRELSNHIFPNYDINLKNELIKVYGDIF